MLDGSGLSSSPGTMSSGQQFGVVTVQRSERNLLFQKMRPHCMLGELCDRHPIEKLVPGTYAITKWRERKLRSDEGLEP